MNGAHLSVWELLIEVRLIVDELIIIDNGTIPS